MRLSRWAAVVAAPVLAIGVSAAPAFADDIHNNLDATVDSAAETMALTAGGANGTTTFGVTPLNGDGKNGCNLNQNNGQTLTVAVVSSAPLVAVASPATLTFTSCGATPTVTITPLTTGTADVTLTPTVNTTGATFNLAPATFQVTVSAANTPPTATLTGVTDGATYDVGSVPTAGCDVVDAEDGNSSGPAALSAITGPYAADGIGSQTATCSYTDSGSLSDSEEATYEIVDPSAPAISYALTPAVANGDNGWWTTGVDVDWTVGEPQSPSSLSTTDCADFSLTADQVATTYTCQATSAGGNASETTEGIKIDGTNPTVDVVGGPTDGATYQLGVDTVPAAPTCDATDATSGVDGDGCVVDGWSDQLGSHTITATATDNAGNSRTKSVSYDVVDPTAPSVLHDLDPATPDGDNGWWTGSVTVDWTVDEPESGGTLATTGCDDLTLTADQVATSYTCEADSAGGHAEETTEDIKIDGTDPTIDLTDGPADGATYYLGLEPVPAAPTCDADDATSGVNGDGCVVDGWSDQLGSHTVTASATDNAGNATSRSRSYDVVECNLETSVIGSAVCAPTCNALDATIKGDGSGPIVGTAGDDVIVGTDGPDEIDGLGGNDTICAFGGADSVTGGEGDDTLFGSADDDDLDGGDGADVINGGSGVDLADGGAGEDVVRGGLDADTLNGGADNDTVNGDGGDDTVNGGDGDDQVLGSSGDDDLAGDGGADSLNGGTGADQGEGNGGNDTLLGAGGADSLSGGADDDVIKGNAGNDTLDGGDGVDQVIGAEGLDQVTGGDGNDALYGGAHGDTMYGGAGDDLLNGGAGNDQLFGEAGNDTVYGNAGFDGLSGGDDDDRLVGGPEVDTLDGGAGTNSLVQ